MQRNTLIHTFLQENTGLFINVEIHFCNVSVFLQYRDEDSRRKQSLFRMFPTNQRFRSDDTVSTHIILGLKECLKLLFLKGIIQLINDHLLLDQFLSVCIIIYSNLNHMILLNALRRQMSSVTHDSQTL